MSRKKQTTLSDEDSALIAKRNLMKIRHHYRHTLGDRTLHRADVFCPDSDGGSADWPKLKSIGSDGVSSNGNDTEG